IFNSRPVTIDVLADEMNFLVAERLEALCFGDDFCRRPAALASTRVRHDAERAKLIATFNNRDESNVRRMSLDWGNIPRVVLTALAEIENSFFAVARSFDQRRNTIGSACSDHHIDRCGVIEYRFAFELGDTAHHANQTISLIGSSSTQFPNARVDFAFRFFANRTRVE